MSVRAFKRPLIRIWIAIASICCSAIAANSQEAQQSPPKQGDATLPEIVVKTPAEAKKVKKSSSAKSQGKAKSGGSVAAQEPGASSAYNSSTNPLPETAYGPVKGFVAHRSATGTKTDTPLIETPQSISVITRDQMEAQGAQSVPQALGYTPGVVPEQRGINTGALEFIFSRGFQAERYLDGMRLPYLFFNIPSYESYNLERIEVLRGPASVLYGQTYPGGLVNLVSKRPTDVPINEVSLRVGSYDQFSTAFDFGGPAGKNGNLSYRISGTYRENDSQIDFAEQERYSVAPALKWEDSDTSLTLLGYYQNDPKIGYYNFTVARGTVLPNKNGKIDPSLYIGEPTYDHFSKEMYSLGYLFEHKLNEALTVRNNLRFSDLNDDLRYLSIRNLNLYNDDTTVQRNMFGNDNDVKSLTIDTQVQAKFDTGPLQHTFLVGHDYQHIDYDRIVTGTYTAGIPDLNLYNPVYGVAIPDFKPASEDMGIARQTGLYAQEQLKIGGLNLMLGVREDWAESENRDAITGSASSSKKDDAFTWRTGAVYAFDNGLAPYASYATSFQPVIGSDYFKTPFVPTTGEQYEGGIKFQPKGFNSFITAAYFDLTQQNVVTPDLDPRHPGASVQTGEIQVKGYEVEARASLSDSFDLVAAYTNLEDTVTKTNTQNQLGKTPVGIPEETASLWANYTFHNGPLAGFGLGAGVRYVGSTWGTASNLWGGTFPTTPSVVPSYTLADAMVRYEFGAQIPYLKGLELSINARNLFDKEYISYCGNINFCQWGQRRVVLGTFTYRW